MKKLIYTQSIKIVIANIPNKATNLSFYIFFTIANGINIIPKIIPTVNQL